MQKSFARRAWCLAATTLFVLGLQRCLHGQSFNELSEQFLAAQSSSRIQEANRLARRGLQFAEAEHDPRRAAFWTLCLASACVDMGHFDEADTLFSKALVLQEQTLGPEHPDVGFSLHALAGARTLRGRFKEAEEHIRQALTIEERSSRPRHLMKAGYLTALARAQEGQGRFSEAEQTFIVAVAIYEDAAQGGRLDKDSAGSFSQSLMGLGVLYMNEGRYAEAEPVLVRALSIITKTPGSHPGNRVPIVEALGILYTIEGRHNEAESLLKWLIEMDDKKDAPVSGRGDHLRRLGELYGNERRFAEAESLLKRALEVDEKAFGSASSQVAHTLGTLASLYVALGNFDQAQPSLERALVIGETALGKDSFYLTWDLNRLAFVQIMAGWPAGAEKLLARAISIAERAGLPPSERYVSYFLRAQIAWKAQRREDAMADLRWALELAEQQRSQTSGAEQEQAKVFGEFAQAFELMVAWQAVLFDQDQALAAMERARARSLVEQMDQRGVNLLAGVPRDQAEELRRREAAARALVSELDKQLSLFAQRRDVSGEQRKQQVDLLRQRLVQARGDYVDAYRDIRNASPAYRLSLSKDRKPVTLVALRDWAAANESLMLEYMVGDAQSFVLVVPPAGGQARIEPLTITADQAAKLGIDAGPLTSVRLQSVLSNPKENGVLQRISTPASDHAAVDQLALLWEVLVPEPERKAIQAGEPKRLIVLPDGPLALLPFEALVVEGGEDPVYLLDAGPPIAYGPSATVLYNLAERPAVAPSPDREPVLAVGDPAYGDVSDDDPNSATALTELTARSRYSGFGARLNRLPHSGTEMHWVAQNFEEAGIKAVTLSQATAT